MFSNGVLVHLPARPLVAQRPFKVKHNVMVKKQMIKVLEDNDIMKKLERILNVDEKGPH